MKAYPTFLVVTLFVGAACLSGVVATSTRFSIQEQMFLSCDGEPVADFIWTPDYPSINELITFDASSSYDPDGYITDYAWDFNDDGRADKTGKTVKWSWNEEERYDVHLSVCDNDLRCSGMDKTIRIVNNTPVALFEWHPSYPSVGTTVTLDASASFDPDGIIAWYAWNYDEDPFWDTVGGEEDMTVTYLWDEPGSYEVTLEVSDADSHADTLTKIIEVTLDHPPVTPSIPQGPSSGKIGASYEYTAVTTDPDDDAILYLFDWGDGTTSSWIGPLSSGQSAYATHAWEAIGTYDIKVQAKDIHDIASEWSPSTTVDITENKPPVQPSTPSGPPTGTIDESYTYMTSATDPDGDQLYYLFDWGDGSMSGWIGPYPSGETVSASQIWEIAGSYEITSKAKDEQGAESPWSDPFSVTMPKGKQGFSFLNLLNWLIKSNSYSTFLRCFMDTLW